MLSNQEIRLVDGPTIRVREQIKENPDKPVRIHLGKVILGYDAGPTVFSITSYFEMTIKDEKLSRVDCFFYGRRGVWSTSCCLGEDQGVSFISAVGFGALFFRFLVCSARSSDNMGS